MWRRLLFRLILSVCLCVCMYVRHTITFESLYVGSSLHIPVGREYWSCSYMKVIRSRSRSQEQKRSTAIQYPRNGSLRVSTNPDPHSVKIPSTKIRVNRAQSIYYTQSGEVCVHHRIFGRLTSYTQQLHSISVNHSPKPNPSPTNPNPNPNPTPT